MKVFGDRLKDLRKSNIVDQENIEKSHPMSQEELGRIFKNQVTKQTISNYEAGISEPDFEGLLAIAKFFNVTPEYLLGTSDFKNKQHEDMHKLSIFKPDTLKNLSGLTKSELDILEILILSPMCEFKFLLNVFLSYYNGIPEHAINRYIGAMGPGGAGAPMTMDLMKYENQMAQMAIANASEYILKYLDGLRPEGGKREWQTVTVVKEASKDET